MATNKTLNPTGVTIQIPEFTDQPDQRVNSNCIDKEADAINALNTAVANIPKVVYNLNIITGQSLFDAAAAFAEAHRGEANVVGRFYLSASYIPSDLPANTNAEKYGYGEIDIRVSPSSGTNFDGKIFLYGFNSNLIYVRDIQNGIAGSWERLALKSDIHSAPNLSPTDTQTQRFTLTTDGGAKIEFVVSKLNSTQNYLQFFLNGTDRGYLIFDVSRNIT